MFSQSSKLLPVTRFVQYSAVERCRRGCTSSLFISRDKGQESCAVLSPHLDLDVRFKDTEMLIKNIQSRGMNIDVNQLKASWQQYQSLKKYMMELEKDRLANTAKFKSAGVHSAQILKELNSKGIKIKDKLKITAKELLEVENKAFLGGLSLPNDINPDTPDNTSEKVLHEFGLKPEVGKSNPSHLDIADKLGLIEYYDSSYYFLKDNAALFEMGISYMVMDKLKEAGFITMSNSDFGKSVVVEGVGLDPQDATSVFTLEKESDSKDASARLHLVGGASLVSFCAYHTKTVTNLRSLPLRYVAMGRHYNPENTMGLTGLFSTWQSSAVEAFILTADNSMAMKEFTLCMKNAIQLYESLGYHFRIRYLPPASLRPWESLHASFEMFSTNMNCYIEVGNLSLCDDYISQRLLMCCETTGKVGPPLGFMHVVSGTVVSVPRLLGCVLEYDSENFKVPSAVMEAVM